MSTTKTTLSDMGRLRKAFYTYCGLDIGLRDSFEDFCLHLRSMGRQIEGSNSWSQGEKWRLNPEPDWDNPQDVHEQLGERHRTRVRH